MPIPGDQTPPLELPAVSDDVAPASPQTLTSPRSSRLEPLLLNGEADFDPLSLGQSFSKNATHYDVGREVQTFSQKHDAFTKLEVLNARDINTLVFYFNVCIAASIAFSIASIALAHTAFKTVTPPLRFERMLTVTLWDPLSKGGAWFERLESAISIMFFIYSVTLLAAYVILLLCFAARVSNEQVWVSLLLGALVLYLNPFDAINRVIRANAKPDAILSGPSRVLTVFFTVLRVTAFSFCNLLYVWLNVDSYRRLEGYVTWQEWRFYMPKIGLVLFYVVYKLMLAFIFDVYFSEVPFMSALGAVRLYGVAKVAPTLGIMAVTFLTLYEAVLIALIVRDVVRTLRCHNRSDYMVHRTKIIGFRFFMHQQAVFYSAFTLIYVLVLLGFPEGNQIVLLFIGYSRARAGKATALLRSNAQGSYFDIQYAPVGLHLALLAYATIEAFCSLPARTHLGACGTQEHKRIGAYAVSRRSQARRTAGMQPQDYDDSEPDAEPISYRRHEVGDGESVTAKPNCFVMATHIKLFNLSWYIYYHGTAKEVKLARDVAQTELSVVACVTSEATDTRVLVLEAADRICVAFKGTSSATNISTDVKLAQTALRSVLPTEVPLETTPDARGPRSYAHGSAEAQTDALCSGARFRRARVHVGFARAYRSVGAPLLRALRELLTARARPVLFCGHSLGGALATLASADLVLQPWWGRLRRGEAVMVSTFGSPMVGNGAFRAIYEELRIAHWRVVAGGDVIARLPTIGYKHVGRRVALSARGDLFVDPDALEARLWHRPTASVVHHRKASYLLALRGWCERHHGQVAHGFWSFPVSKADSKRFQEALSRNAPSSSALMAGAPVDADERGRIYAARLQVWKDAVEMLEPRSVRHQHGAMSGIDMWCRLTKPVLGDLRAHADMMDDDVGPLSVALQIVTRPDDGGDNRARIYR